MTTEIDFQTWRLEFADNHYISLDELHYELTDSEGNRRLDEVIDSSRTKRRDGSVTDENQILFSFDARGPDIERRYRFEKPNEVRLWYTLSYEITEIHERSVDTEQDYTFEIGFSTSDALDESSVRGENSPQEVNVPRGTFENGDYRPIRAFRVAGLSDQREIIREFIRSDGSRWGLAPEHGMLLEGPPGTGKTEIVMEICREEFGAVPVEISGPEILSRWLGESERMLRERFEQARSNPSNVLYIDEIDSIARSRGKSTQEYSAQIVAQLLVLLDGLDTKRDESPVKVIASTNMASLIDEALRRPGRLGRTVSFDPLSGTDTLAVLHHYLEKIYRNQQNPLDRTSSDPEVGELSTDLQAFVTEGDVERLECQDAVDDVLQFLSGRTGAEIEQIVQRGTRYADEISDDGSTGVLEPEHLFDVQSNEKSIGNVVYGDVTVTSQSQFATSRVLCVPPERGQEAVKEEFQKFLCNHSEYEEGMFRTIRPTEELFSADEDTVWSQIWEHFRVERGYPVCVYLHGYDRLARVADHSPVAQAIIEALCERLVAEPNPSSPPILFGFASTDDSGSSHFEEFTADWIR